MQNSTIRGVILFGHGARDPEWARPFHALREIIIEKNPGTPVELAFLELSAPTLGEAVERQVTQGINSIVVVPVFIAAGRHVKQDMPAMLKKIRQRYPDLTIEMTLVIGESTKVLDAMADWVLSTLS